MGEDLGNGRRRRAGPHSPSGLKLTAAVLLGLVSVSCAADRRIWFAPNLASRDMVRLFTHPKEWQETRKHVGVFQFYAAQLGAADDCPECGENDLAHFEAANAFKRLDDWGLAMGVEVPAIKEWECVADATVPLVERVTSRVHAAGGEVAFLVMDEPLLGGERCGQKRDATADEVARYLSSLRSALPGVSMGDVEPYPHFDATEIVDWLDALSSRGTPVAFLHVDVDRPRAAVLAKDVAGDLATLRAACEERGIPLGVIFWGGDGLDEAGYAADVLGWVDAVKEAIGAPAHIVFQSWSVSPTGLREVPLNLPEDSPDIWTHTRLIREGLRRLDDGP